MTWCVQCSVRWATVTGASPRLTAGGFTWAPLLSLPQNIPQTRPRACSVKCVSASRLQVVEIYTLYTILLCNYWHCSPKNITSAFLTSPLATISVLLNNTNSNTGVQSGHCSVNREKYKDPAVTWLELSHWFRSQLRGARADSLFHAKWLVSSNVSWVIIMSFKCWKVFL